MWHKSSMPPSSPPGGGNQYRTLSIPLHQQAEWDQRVLCVCFYGLNWKTASLLLAMGGSRDVSQSLHLRWQLKNNRPPFCITIVRYSSGAASASPRPMASQASEKSNLTTIHQEWWLVTILAFMSSFYVTSLSQPPENNPEMFLKEDPFTQNGDPPPVYVDFRWMKWESSYKKSWDTSNPNACVWL